MSSFKGSLQLNTQYEQSLELSRSAKELEQQHYEELKKQYEELTKPHTKHEEILNKLSMLDSKIRIAKEWINSPEASDVDTRDLQESLFNAENLSYEASKSWLNTDYTEADKLIDEAYDLLDKILTPTIEINVTLDGETITLNINVEGKILEAIHLTSEDVKLSVSILSRTIALDEEGDPITSLEFTVDEMPPPPPPQANIVGLPYNFEPAGATFDPPITITWSYDPADIPPGVVKEDLVLAYYDEDSGGWVVLPSVVDPLTNTITASVGHFTTFAIVAYTPLPTPPLIPAAFTTSSLSISPLEVNIGEPVTISVLVTNIGEEIGIYTVTLKINGVVEATKEITLASGASRYAVFFTSKNKDGTYWVTINGLVGSFIVKAAPPPPTKLSWWLIGIIIAAVFIAIAIPLTLRWRRRKS